MPPRKWADPVKAQALELFASEGVHVASRETGVPVATIRSWAARTVREVEAAAGVELVVAGADPVPWQQRRAEVLATTGELVVLALDRVRKAFEEDKLRDARDGSVALGILIDKAQLLSGAATGRHESLTVNLSGDEVRAQIETLERELGLQ